MGFRVLWSWVWWWVAVGCVVESVVADCGGVWLMAGAGLWLCVVVCGCVWLCVIV